MIKVDHSTGSTIWGKNIGYIVGTDILILRSVSIQNVKIYTILASDPNQVSRSLIAIFNYNGDVIEAFGIIHPFNSTDTPNYYLLPTSINAFSDGSYIFGSLSSYVENSFGVSSYSFMDLTFIRFNQDKNISWVTSIDWMLQRESEHGVYAFKNQLFFIFESNYTNYCLGALDLIRGYEVQPSKWLYIQNNQTADKTVSILIISESWVIASVPNGWYYSSKDIAVFNTTSFALTKLFLSRISLILYS